MDGTGDQNLGEKPLSHDANSNLSPGSECKSESGGGGRVEAIHGGVSCPSVRITSKDRLVNTLNGARFNSARHHHVIQLGDLSMGRRPFAQIGQSRTNAACY